MAADEAVVIDDAPLVVAGVFTAASAVGLFIMRSAPQVDRRPQRSGIIFALSAGIFYALNLGLLFGAMPLIGAGAATALGMMSPLPVVVLSMIFLRLRPSWWVCGALLAALAGGRGSPATPALC